MDVKDRIFNCRFQTDSLLVRCVRSKGEVQSAEGHRAVVIWGFCIATAISLCMICHMIHTHPPYVGVGGLQ